MRTVAEEVERCLPYFVRLCVNSVIVSGAPLDEASRHVALDLSDKMRRQTGMSADQQDHFYSALEQLIQLVSALSPRLPPDLLRDFAEKATQAQVSSTLERSLMGALKSEAT